MGSRGKSGRHEQKDTVLRLWQLLFRGPDGSALRCSRCGTGEVAEGKMAPRVQGNRLPDLPEASHQAGMAAEEQQVTTAERPSEGALSATAEMEGCALCLWQ